MAVFIRCQRAPKVKGDHTEFRPFVREDFSEGCAYCLLHELLAGGPRNFELDHFRPKSFLRFAALIADFFTPATFVMRANGTVGLLSKKKPSALASLIFAEMIFPIILERTEMVAGYR